MTEDRKTVLQRKLIALRHLRRHRWSAGSFNFLVTSGVEARKLVRELLEIDPNAALYHGFEPDDEQRKHELELSDDRRVV